MNTHIQMTTDAKGRTCYTVAGVVTTYDAQEAMELTADIVGPIRCVLTRQVLEPQHVFRAVTFRDEISGMPGVRVEKYEAA